MHVAKKMVATADQTVEDMCTTHVVIDGIRGDVARVSVVDFIGFIQY